VTLGARLLTGDALSVLRSLPDASVRCCVTSPPYWSLRDYGMEGQIGLEQTPEDYVAQLVMVFREVRRVLTDDGTLWLNLGDSYATRGGAFVPQSGVAFAHKRRGLEVICRSKRRGRGNGRWGGGNNSAEGVKPKDLVGIPWLVAFALRADGWYLRSDIIWAKPNPMPESVRDRPTKSHEYLFLFAKGQSRTRTIPFSDVKPERVHFGRDLGTQRQSVRDTTRLSISIAAAVFYAAQLEQDFSLPPFYAEEWKQRTNGDGSLLVADLPPIHRAAAHAARLLNADASAKEFLCEMHGLWGDLRDRDHLLIGRALTECADPPGVLVDGNTAIAVNDASKPCKVDFGHARIVVTVPTTCQYFYDADAIAEPLQTDPKENYPARAVVTGRGQQSFNGIGARLNDRDKGGGFPPRRSGNVQRDIPSDADGRGITNDHRGRGFPWEGVSRNVRSVWTIATQQYSGAHFATYPEELASRCIKAGSAPGDTVLDPFSGSGTTAAVAIGLGRTAIGIELRPMYQELARARIGPLLCEVG